MKEIISPQLSLETVVRV